MLTGGRTVLPLVDDQILFPVMDRDALVQVQILAHEAEVIGPVVQIEDRSAFLLGK